MPAADSLPRSVLEQACTLSAHGQIITDAKGEIVLWNDWMERASGVASSEARGNTLEDLFGELPARFVQTFQRSLEASVASVISRAFLPHPLPLLNQQFRDRKMVQGVTVHGFSDESGERYCLISIVDHSKSAQRETLLNKRAVELQEKNSQLDAFTHMVGHDLRAPLGSISGLITILREDLGESPSPAVDTDLTMIETSVRRMRRLVRSMLDMAQMERRVTKPTRFRLANAVDAALAQLREAIESSKGSITHDALPVIMGDQGLITQLYQNLINNALKFVRGDTPRIHLTAERLDNGDVLLGVHDNGIGIEKDQADRIFAPFHRLHREAEYEGSGIGLSICKRIVTLHEGKIWFDTDVPVGSLVRVQIPQPRESE